MAYKILLVFALFAIFGKCYIGDAINDRSEPIEYQSNYECGDSWLFHYYLFECDTDNDKCTLERCINYNCESMNEYKKYDSECNDDLDFDDPFNNQIKYQPSPSEFEALQDLYTNTGGDNWISSSKNLDIRVNVEWFMDVPECCSETHCNGPYYRYLTGGNQKIYMAYGDFCYSYLYQTEFRGPCGTQTVSQNFEHSSRVYDVSNDGWFGIICGEETSENNSPRHIETLLISYNGLDGTFPDSMGNLNHLVHLFAHGNSISGSLPSSLGTISTLTHLYIFDNEITSLGTGITSMTNLEKLYFEDNQIDDGVDWIKNLKKLQIINGENNQLQGQIPEIPSDHNLQHLNLNNNGLTGTLPSSLLNHPGIRTIQLADNELSGAIPNIETISQDLTQLDLSGNNFACRLPPFIEEESTIEIDLTGSTFFCPIIAGSNVVVDSCSDILMTGIDFEQYQKDGGSAPNDITLSGTGMLTDSCEFQCYFKNIYTGEEVIEEQTGFSASSITCDFPADDLEGGVWKVCLGQNDRSVVPACSFLKVFYDCGGECELEDGVCNEDDGICICPTNKSGTRCEFFNCHGCNEANGGGYCDESLEQCVCEDNYAGPHCDVSNICDPECVFGTCNYLVGVCECDNFRVYGESCNQTLCPTCHPVGSSGCNPNGTCICNEYWDGELCNNPTRPCPGDCNIASGGGSRCDHETGECVCNFGYTGPNCEGLSCPLDCSGNGNCSTTNGTCTCEDGYSGAACNVISIECDPPCCSSGSCNKNTGKCTCGGRSFGSSCCLIGCTDNCNENGVCDTSTGICTCDENWIGADCSVGSFDCPDCGEHGICNRENGKCSCESKYFGDQCEFKECTNNCTGRGICNYTSGICICESDYDGDSCGKVVCHEDCNNGTCDFRYGECNCLGTWRDSPEGDKCKLPVCPGNCSGSGECLDDGTCACSGRWSGEACNIQTEDPVTLAFVIIICILVTLAVIIGIFMLWRNWKIGQLKQMMDGEGEAMDDQGFSDSS
eukprot:TRINITY_DN1727_c0_g1_i1.p1 TRINITY_DN1727_c0_g1~~TRINITY_DN1727_c0_g1_i1.p1  ORF type:complete len:1006 (+),score=245.16 TRINITY_DN1727_c0_g1_i1:45-3062(+)